MRKLLIKGGQVVFADEVKAADILLENGKKRGEIETT